MIYTINVVTKTKDGDAYDGVAVNKYPIVFLDNDDVETVLQDEDLVACITRYIRNATIYNNAELYIRVIDDELEPHKYVFKLNEKINIGQWKDSQTVSS